MIKSDRELIWRPGRVYYPIAGSDAIIGAAGVGAGVHTGAPVEQEVSTFGFVGILLDTAGDMVVTGGKIPYDLDVHQKVKVRVVWTCGSTDVADTIDFIVLYRALTPEVTALAVPSTALDTTIAQDTVPAATAYTVNSTAWGVINANTISEQAEHWQFLVEMDAFAAGLAEDKFALGVEVLYTPKRLKYGDGMAQEAKAPTYMLGKHFSD